MRTTAYYFRPDACKYWLLYLLHIERLPEDEDIAVIHHVKSSLTTKSKDVYFTLDGNRRVEWLEQPFEVQPDKSTKQMIASSILKTRLANGPAKATDVLEELKNEGIGERTIHQVKKQLEIRSVKRDMVLATAGIRDE